MCRNRIVTENQLDVWVRGNAREAQGVIVELVYRLVAASVPRPKERRFPLGDSIEQPGPDGFLDTDLGFDPFVPTGRSFWEIGTGIKAGDKATSDYGSLTAETSDDVRRESTFVFVTPLSARRDWQHTWKEDGQANWLKVRRQRNEWRDVCVIDGTGLIDWLHHFPSVELWLAEKMGFPVKQIQTPERRWADLRTIGAPPLLTPEVFLVNRDAACEEVKKIFSGTIRELQLDTRFPEQMADFVAAYVVAMNDEAMVDTVGRCLFISGTEGWSAVTTLREAHVLIADFDIYEADSAGAKLLQSALKSGHSVIVWGMPGGMPHSDRVTITSPKSYQIKEVLEKAGYNEERARILAEKSNGNLSVLLRCLQNLPPTPEWAQGPDAGELAIAELLGAWTDHSEADKEIVERLSTKTYENWIEKMREIALRPATPLSQKNGVWRIVSRYEGWYALGPTLFDQHLDRLKEAAVSVLCEPDPKFELSPNKRYTANIRGKILIHSPLLRKGLAESLALLGSHPKALTSCSFGKAEGTANVAVREILANADWVLWASLNDLLPLFAEAAPGELLDAVDTALKSDPCPYDTVFAQEGSGIMGGNYMTGLLWALETLAWDAAYLTRVVVTLGELATRDPGGNYRNRPANSLYTILLPWLPQTCASVSKRRDAVATLQRELPDTAWKLLLDILPSSHQTTSRSRKPTWREMIPDDWSKGVSHHEYWEQIDAYASLAVTTAKHDHSKLVDLIDRLNNLPPSSSDQLLSHLRSDTVLSLSEQERLLLWTKLVDLVSAHRNFSDANWAMKPEMVDEIAAIAETLAPDAPIYLYQRLFNESESHLYEENGNYEEQRKVLQDRRERAVKGIFADGGMEAILEFAKAVESAQSVGIAFGVVAENNADPAILPELLDTENKTIAQFVGAFVRGRFHARNWQWVDEIDTSQWTPTQKGQFLAYLPFTPDTWERSDRLLGKDDSAYWSRTSANPYEAGKSLELAVDRLVKHDRPQAAIGCLHRMTLAKQPLDSQQAVKTLLAGLDSSEGVHEMAVHYIVDIIKALQEDPNTNPDDLFQVEWGYLPLLDRYHDASPKLLEQRLADEPDFFCELIRIIFRSNNEEPAIEEPTERERNIATNAHQLLHNWKTPPGSQKDGSYNGADLDCWLKQVKEACKESGHLEVALIMIGGVLIHTPPDPDGHWIHRSVAAALNTPDANDMRQGFRTALFNSRGVHGFTAGQEERELATKYRMQADEVESRGYHRLAGTLRELAISYEREAEREESSDPFDD